MSVVGVVARVLLGAGAVAVHVAVLALLGWLVGPGVTVGLLLFVMASVLFFVFGAGILEIWRGR